MALNEDQKHAFELFQQGQSIFITGPGGCGKSYLLKYIKDVTLQLRNFYTESYKLV